MVTDVQKTHALGQIILFDLSMSFLHYYYDIASVNILWEKY